MLTSLDPRSSSRPPSGPHRSADVAQKKTILSKGELSVILEDRIQWFLARHEQLTSKTGDSVYVSRRHCDSAVRDLRGVLRKTPDVITSSDQFGRVIEKFKSVYETHKQTFINSSLHDERRFLGQLVEQFESMLRAQYSLPASALKDEQDRSALEPVQALYDMLHVRGHADLKKVEVLLPRFSSLVIDTVPSALHALLNDAQLPFLYAITADELADLKLYFRHAFDDLRIALSHPVTLSRSHFPQFLQEIHVQFIQQRKSRTYSFLSPRALEILQTAFVDRVISDITAFSSVQDFVDFTDSSAVFDSSVIDRTLRTREDEVYRFGDDEKFFMLELEEEGVPSESFALRLNQKFHGGLEYVRPEDVQLYLQSIVVASRVEEALAPTVSSSPVSVPQVLSSPVEAVAVPPQYPLSEQGFRAIDEAVQRANVLIERAGTPSSEYLGRKLIIAISRFIESSKGRLPEHLLLANVSILTRLCDSVRLSSSGTRNSALIFGMDLTYADIANMCQDADFLRMSGQAGLADEFGISALMVQFREAQDMLRVEETRIRSQLQEVATQITSLEQEVSGLAVELERVNSEQTTLEEEVAQRGLILNSGNLQQVLIELTTMNARLTTLKERRATLERDLAEKRTLLSRYQTDRQPAKARLDKITLKADRVSALMDQCASNVRTVVALFVEGLAQEMKNS